MAGNGTKEVNLTEIQKSYLAISRQISNTVLTEEDSERYSGFVMWLRNINQLAEDFYTPDENGNYPVMDQVSLNAFQDSYKRALEECDDVLAQNSNDGISGRMKEIAGEVRKHLLRDSAGFESIVLEEGKTYTLDEVISLGRTLTVDIGQQQFSGMGGQMSSRIPIQVPDAPGGSMDGFFTKSSNVNTDVSMKRLRQKMQNEHPAMMELFDTLEKTDSKKLLLSGLANIDMYTAIAKGVSRAHAPWPETKEDMAKYACAFFKQAFSEILPKEKVEQLVAQPDFLPALDEYFREKQLINNNRSIYTAPSEEWLGVKEGSNIDKRNAAMASVSELLGKKGLIADAKPMIVLIDGQPTAGTFMNRADGYNARDGRQDNPMRESETDAYNNPEIFDDVASMQAIDFICGNLDRHDGNFMLHFSEKDGKKKVDSIVAIDNDLAFGLNVPKPGDKTSYGNKFILPENMGAIGEQTAQKISDLTEDELKIVLRGYGLSKEEMDAAWERTKILQQAILEGKEFYKDAEEGVITAGHLRVVPEKDWNKYDLKDLANDTATTRDMNQFATLLNMKSIVRKNEENEKMKATRKARTKQIREVLFEEAPKAANAEPVTAVPVGTGIRYQVSKRDRLGVENPENVRVVIPENSKLSSMSGSNNERIPLSYPGADGNPVEGFFTSSVKIDGKAQVRKIFEKHIAQQMGENGDPVRADILRRTYEYWKQNPGKRYTTSNFDFVKIGFDPETAAQFKADKKLMAYYRQVLGNVILTDKMYRENYTEIGANMEGDIDKRNIAMSKMSDLLGVSKCIAHATTMQVQGAEGKITEGIFMRKAPGTSFMGIEPGDEVAKLKTAVFDGSPALKDLADIQIMDYICMNVDRNESNLFYEFSEDGKKCLGVTGIDNDLSFGTVRLAPDRSINQDTALNDIKVISATMAEKISNMSESALRNTLDGQGLTDKEIEAAMDRLVNIQEKVKAGQIRVVQDNEWENMKLSELAEGGNNIFGKVNHTFTESLDAVLRSKQRGEEPEKQKVEFPECTKVENFSKEALKATEEDRIIREEEQNFLNGLKDQYKDVAANQPMEDADVLKNLKTFAKLYGRRIEDGNSVFHGASQFYVDLNNRVREFSEQIQQLDEKAGRNEKLTGEDLSAVIGGLNRIRTAAANYTGHVEAQEHPSRTQRKRLGIVNELSGSLDNISQLAQINTDKRELLKKPEEVLFRKLHTRQEMIAQNANDEEKFKKDVAGMIYLTGISQNVVSLTKEKKLTNALLLPNYNKNVEEIMADPAFAEMMTKNGKDDIKRMAAAGNGEELLRSYTRQRAAKKTSINDMMQQDNPGRQSVGRREQPIQGQPVQEHVAGGRNRK